jgi:hypothetical protein
MDSSTKSMLRRHQRFGNGFRIFRDGDAWCAVGPEFFDVQTSIAGFGHTPYKAFEDWWVKTRRQPREVEWPTPSIADFTIYP